jgi:hypothetical protein
MDDSIGRKLLLGEEDQHLVAGEADGLPTGIEEAAYQHARRHQKRERDDDLKPDSRAAQDGSLARGARGGARPQHRE